MKAAEDIETFTAGMSFTEFVNDDKTISAALYKFAIMGEATKMLPDHIREHTLIFPGEALQGCVTK